MINILHSFPAHEQKFKKFCQLTFSLEEVNNYYVDNLALFEDDLNGIDIIVIHYLRWEDTDFLTRNKLLQPVIWFAWGADIFNLGKFHHKFFLPKTKRLKYSLSLGKSTKFFLKLVAKSINPSRIDQQSWAKSKINAFKNIDYIVPVMPGDYALLHKKYNVEFELFHLNYVNPVLQETDFKQQPGKNILLGNSSTYTNNHVEAIDFLTHQNLKGRKVIIPLSYGNEDLANYVTDYAKNKLNNSNLMILKDFMPFEEYKKLIESCGIVIMNHVRQQGVGNIVQALLNGSHVYLRKESTVYKFLKTNGFKIGAINNCNKLIYLNTDEIVHNRKLAQYVFGMNKQHNRVRNLIEQAINK